MTYVWNDNDDRVKWVELRNLIQEGIAAGSNSSDYTRIEAFLPIGGKKIYNFPFGGIFQKITQNKISRNNC